jgi:homoserine dehydrogenase
MPPADGRVPIVADEVSAFYVHLEVDDEPGVLSRIAGLFGEAGASIKSVVQRGTGEAAQLTMVTHPIARSRLAPALEMIGELAYVRSTPRAISVIDEEFE